MSRLSIARGAAVLLAAIAAAATPAAASAQTTTPPAPKVFHACYVPSSGTIYRIKEVDLKQECAKTTHVQFSWTDGAQALTTVFTVKSDYKNVPAHGYDKTTAVCPAGTQVTGGGWEIAYFPNNVVAPVIWRNHPLDDKNGWEVGFQNTTDNLASFIAYVRCAK